MSSTALITGITGQDGSYLAELLLDKGYHVIGLVSPQHNPLGTTNITHLRDQVTLVEGDLLDRASLQQILATHQPNEIYNLAGVTFVPAAWQQPTQILDINLLGVARLLELMRDELPQARLFQASSAKIFGAPTSAPQTEMTALAPQDPYGISKAAAHLLVQTLRRQFGLYAVCGILYNHESERRGPDFVTRKITLGAAQIKLGQTDRLALGDLDSQIDWGYAPDFVDGIWRMLQADRPDDYLLATGQLHAIRDVCSIAFGKLGLDYQKYVRSDPALRRTMTATALIGDSAKARTELDWQPRVSFQEMIERMVEYDYQQLQKESRWQKSAL